MQEKVVRHYSLDIIRYVFNNILKTVHQINLNINIHVQYNIIYNGPNEHRGDIQRRSKDTPCKERGAQEDKGGESARRGVERKGIESTQTRGSVRIIGPKSEEKTIKAER